jgi:putative FmdB family regulatory protein
MPTYDYKCSACSHTFEHMQSMRDKPLRKCPKCGKAALERLIGTGGAIIFKGGGFYQTDYRSESYKKAAEAESKPAASESKTGGDSPSPAKTETQTTPATPAPAKASDSKPPSEPGKSKASEPVQGNSKSKARQKP